MPSAESSHSSMKSSNMTESLRCTPTHYSTGSVNLPGEIIFGGFYLKSLLFIGSQKQEIC